jgi:recombination protein RecA
VIDSVAALSPIKEIDGESGDAHVGLLARLMSQALRRISGVAKKTNTALLFVNQYRMMIGMTGYGGPSKTTPGGKALSFYASIRLDVARIQTVGSGNESTANRTRVTVKKNKVASPYRIAEFDVVFGEGVSQEGEVIDACIMLGYIKKAGAWLKDADGNTICQGREALKDLFKSNREMFELYKSKVVNESIAGYGGVGEE